MTQTLAPELFLSLLSGRPGGVSHISTDPCHTDVSSRISDHPFGNNPNRLTDLLDAFASICVRKEKGEVFSVSLAMDPDSATLYVASNDTVTHNITTYLYKIWGQLKALNALSKFDAPTLTDKESPDPNNIQSSAFIALELELKKTIYEHSYKKLRRRFLKRAPLVLEMFPAIETKFQSLAPEDKNLLSNTIPVLGWLNGVLKNENLPPVFDFVTLIQTIDVFSKAWQSHLNTTEDEPHSILTRWDNLICKSGLVLNSSFHNSSPNF